MEQVAETFGANGAGIFGPVPSNVPALQNRVSHLVPDQGRPVRGGLKVSFYGYCQTRKVHYVHFSVCHCMSKPAPSRALPQH